MPETCLWQTCAYIHALSMWLKVHLLPLAPLFAPAIAIVAGGIALYSIHVTRSIARNRASVDFFLKTDMDKGMVEAYSNFIAGFAVWMKFKETKKPSEFIEDTDETLSSHRENIFSYLNVHELVAIGIKKRIFDEDVCFKFWSIALVRHTRGTIELIEYQRTLDGYETSYSELMQLYERWGKRMDRTKKKPKRNKKNGTGGRSDSLPRINDQKLVRPSQENTAVAAPLNE